MQRMRSTWHGTGLALAAIIGLSAIATNSADAAALDKIRGAGRISLGYLADARPFSAQDPSGGPAGFSIALCEKVAEEVKSELGLPELPIDWVLIDRQGRFEAVTQGKVDLLCGADTVTLARRAEVSFSTPIFPSGIGAIMRSDAPPALRDILSGVPASGPVWRASPARILNSKTFAAVKDTTGVSWLDERVNTFDLSANVVQVDSYEAGIEQLVNRDVDVFFGDRSILMEASAAIPSASDLVVLDRLFTSEPVALTLQRNDDDFRLVVDRALSKAFKTGDFPDLYKKWFGAPDLGVLAFFHQNALPE